MRFIRFHAAALTFGLMFAFALIAPLPQQAAFAQATNSSGAIQGTVTDPTGALVPYAKVTIAEASTGFQKTLTASSAGIYLAGSLAPGKYTVTVVASGFAKYSREIVVQVGETANGDIKLALGNQVTLVTVEGSAVQVDTSGSTVEGVLDRQQIDTLPLNGRNFLDMAQLQPGVQIQDGTSFDPTKNGFASISFGGRFGRTARITLDGVDISDENVGTTTQNVSEDAIQEFQIAESSLDISTSLTSSGSVNIVTRSGTNKYHGDGFYNFRDERALDAKPSTYTPIPGVDADYMQRNNQGAAVGGPILHDKLFFFAQYEYFRQNVFNGVLFGGPLASVNGGYPVKFHETLSMGRLDYNGSRGIHAFARWNYNNNSDVAAFGGSNYSPFLNRDNTPDVAGGVDFGNGNFTHSFRAGYFKFVNHIADATAGSGIYDPTPGINLVINSGSWGFSTGPNLLAPQATVQSNRQVKYDGSWVKGSHTLRYGIGIDVLRGGGYASFFGLAPQVGVIATTTNGVLLAAENGPFPAIGPTSIQDEPDGLDCTGVPAGENCGTYGKATNPLNYEAGAGDSNLIIFGNGEGYDTEIPSFGFPGGGQSDDRFNYYISDTWKITHSLTVNYGLRYVRDTGRDDADLPAIPALDAVLPGLGDRTNQPNMNYGPQAGFAYDLKGDGKTVIRGGAGVYYENNVWNNVLFDRPAKLAKGLFFGTEAFSCPGGPSFCSQPVGNVYSAISAAQTAYQAATIAAGASSNGEYIPNAMAVVTATEGLSIFAPNYKTPSSYQINIGVQRQLHPGVVLSADYVRNKGIHALVGRDVNHVGDARYLNTAAANTAVANAVSACGVANIDLAIAACPGLHPAVGTSPAGPLTIADLSGYGLDSENVTSGGFPGGGAAFAGANPAWGDVDVLYPAGSSDYNALDVSLAAQVHHLIAGVEDLNLLTSYTYSHYDATGTASLGDADFGGQGIDNNNPTKYYGPTSLDRHNQFSIGMSFKTFEKVELSTIAHLYSSLPTNLNLQTFGAGDIFIDDVTGDGTTGDLVPGTNVGAFNRTYNGKNINKLISQYNATYAGTLTPAGQALVSAGVLTSAEMTGLGAVQQPIAAAPANQPSNDILRSWDVTIGRTIHIRGDHFTINPTFAAFNVLNAVNYNNRTGANGANVIGGQLNGLEDSPNGTTGHAGEDNYRVSAGSGVYAEGSPRQIEYGLKLTF